MFCLWKSLVDPKSNTLDFVQSPITTVWKKAGGGGGGESGGLVFILD